RSGEDGAHPKNQRVQRNGQRDRQSRNKPDTAARRPIRKQRKGKKRSERREPSSCDDKDSVFAPAHGAFRPRRSSAPRSPYAIRPSTTTPTTNINAASKAESPSGSV